MVTKEKHVSITQAEWEIMKVVWANDSVTSRFVLGVLGDTMEWSMSTVKTLLARLVDKEYLTTQKNGKQFIYEALVNEEVAVNTLLEQDLDKICQKKKGRMIYQLIEEQELSEQDIDNLVDLLTVKKRNAPKKLACNCVVGQCNCHK